MILSEKNIFPKRINFKKDEYKQFCMVIATIFREVKKNTLEGKVCFITSRKKPSEQGLMKIYPCGKEVPYDEENRCKMTHQCAAYQAFTRDGIQGYEPLKEKYVNP